jgi:hypothetical protein
MLSTYCPRLSEYEKLFLASPRLQNALSDFYAVVVVFCSKALRVVQEKGETILNNYSLTNSKSHATLIGIKRFSKSIWTPFKKEFKDIEESISAAKDEVGEELRLASEQAAHGFRRMITTDVDENKIFRLTQKAEIQENKQFRSQQALAQHQAHVRQIQKIIKEQGISLYLKEVTL